MYYVKKQKWLLNLPLQLKRAEEGKFLLNPVSLTYK